MARNRQRRKCHAHCADDGRPCPNWAMTGQQVCASHGGITRQAKAAAARRVTEAKAIEVYQAYSPNGAQPVNVVGELAQLVREVTDFKSFAAGRLAALTADQWQTHDPQTSAEIGMFERACDRAARLLTDVAKLGLLEKAIGQQALLERSRAERIVEGLQLCLDYLDLTLEQRKRLPNGLSATLLFLAGEREVQDGDG